MRRGKCQILIAEKKAESLTQINLEDSCKETLFLKAHWSFWYLVEDCWTAVVRSSSLMKSPPHQHNPCLLQLSPLVWRQVPAFDFFASFYVVSPASKIIYAGSLFCHIGLTFLPHQQGYYSLFFLLLKKIIHKWAEIFPALSPLSRLLTHLPYCPPAQHTSKHQQLLCPPLYLFTKGN